MKTLPFRLRPFGCLVLVLLGTPSVYGQPQTYTWNSTSGTNWAGTETAGVWDRGIGQYPGLSTRGIGGGANNDRVQISAEGNFSASTSLGIDFGATGNGVGNKLTIGALLYNPASGTDNSFVLGSNGSTNGTLSFTGYTFMLDSYAIKNDAAGGGNLTIGPSNGGTGRLAVEFSGSGDISSRGGTGATFGNTTTISADISGNAQIRFFGGGDANNRGGTLILSGTNTTPSGVFVGYNEGSFEAGVFGIQAGRLVFANGAAVPGNNATIINTYSQLVLASPDTYGGTQYFEINSLGAASGTNLSQGGLRYDPTTNGTASLNSLLLVGTNAGVHVEGSANTLVLTSIDNRSVSGTEVLGKLTKTGAGTLVFGGFNSHAGGTDVTAGTLVLRNNNSFFSTSESGGSATGTGDIRVRNGGTFATEAHTDRAVLQSGITFESGSTLDIGQGGIGTVSFARPTVIVGGNGSAWNITLGDLFNTPTGLPHGDLLQTLTLDLTGVTDTDKLILNVDGTGLNLPIGFPREYVIAQYGSIVGLTNSGVLNPNNFVVNATGFAVESFRVTSTGGHLILTLTAGVPEPATVLLICMGGVGLFRVVRRRSSTWGTRLACQSNG